MKTIKIKDRKDKVLFTHTCDNNTTNITLQKALSERADLEGVILIGANLRDACLRVANLRDACLRDANLTYANLIGANLRDSDLTGADLRGADLRGADLEDVILIGANLTGANLEGANLRDVWLRDANLTGANLRDAWLRDADLRGANLTDVIINNPLKKDPEDKVVTKVINSFRERSEQGINKYGTTLQRDDLSPLEWMQHLQEELMDATLYIAVLKNKLINLEIKEAEDKVSDVCD